MPYSDIVERTGTSRTAREIPETVASSILSDTIETSAAFQLLPTMRMAAYTHRMPVQKGFATAYWINGATQADKDSGHKQTTSYTWDNVYLTPDEVAVLVPVPDAWMADSNIAWSEIKGELRRAFAKKIDQAVFFGAGSVPTGFSGPSGGLVGGALDAGNDFELGSGLSDAGTNDIYLDLGQLPQELEEQGFDVSGFAAKKGFHWKFNNLRTTTGDAPFQRGPEVGKPGSLWDATYTEVGNGAWDNSQALVLAGDFSYSVLGVRQDMTFSVHEDGIIQDPDTGDIIYNAMQQDGKVLRAVMRLGFQVAVPAKVLGGEYPFAVLTPASVS